MSCWVATDNQLSSPSFKDLRLAHIIAVIMLESMKHLEDVGMPLKMSSEHQCVKAKVPA
jgi:hypothetical protein